MRSLKREIRRRATGRRERNEQYLRSRHHRRARRTHRVHASDVVAVDEHQSRSHAKERRARSVRRAREDAGCIPPTRRRRRAVLRTAGSDEKIKTACRLTSSSSWLHHSGVTGARQFDAARGRPFAPVLNDHLT